MSERSQEISVVLKRTVQTNAEITQTINNTKFVTLTVLKICGQQGWKWLFTIL